MVSESIRKIIEWKKREVELNLFLRELYRGKQFSYAKLYITPLGEKIVIYCGRARLIVGRKGIGVHRLAALLKKKFKFENPQIEVREVENPFLDANIMAERTALLLEKYGVQRFKVIGYRVLQAIMDAGAKGAEIIMSGKIPGQRAKSWRFFAGYMAKSGQANIELVRKGFAIAYLKPGVVGVKVRIMPPDVRLPDEVIVREPEEINIEALASIDPEILKNFKETFEEESKETNSEQ